MSTLQVTTASFRSAKMFTRGLIGNLKLRHWCVWLFVSVCGLAVNRRDWLQHLSDPPRVQGRVGKMANNRREPLILSLCAPFLLSSLLAAGLKRGWQERRSNSGQSAGTKESDRSLPPRPEKNHRCAALIGAISWRCDDCGWAGVKGSRGGSGGGARGRSQSE